MNRTRCISAVKSCDLLFGGAVGGVQQVTALVAAMSVMLTCAPIPVHAGEQPRQPDAQQSGRIPQADLAGIRHAYDAARHAVRESPSGEFQARNPGQQWNTLFDGCGFETVPDSGSWSWGLQLERFGRQGAEHVVGSPLLTHSSGGRVSYEWSDSLTEWFINDERGLEHGFTVHKRPDCVQPPETREPLRLTMAVRGELAASVSSDGRDVAFLTSSGTAALTYSGLTVFDASGQSVPARFEPVDGGAADRMLLVIDDSAAAYPLTIDPIAQQAYLKASNTDASDEFGREVAISGNTAVVGANREDSSATGVNGNQANNGATDAGAAYVFVRNGSTWSQQAYLKASNTGVGDRFGFSVSISNDTIVVGAVGEDSASTGVNSNQASDSALDAGAAYVFVRSGTTWTQQAYLKASNTNANDYFGSSVSIVGDTIVAGARWEDSSATGVNGTQSNNSATDSGAAYVFVRSGSTWTQQAYLKASNTEAGDLFSEPVSISGDTIVVGALGEDSNSPGVNGNQADNGASGAGAAYVFVRSGSTWVQQAYLKASNPDSGDAFGGSVGVSGNTIVVGASFEDSSATGVNGNQANNTSLDAGSAYVFVRNGAVWTQQAYLKQSNTDPNDGFGESIAVFGDFIVVGATGEDSSAIGVDGSQANNAALDSGAVYAFRRTGTTWEQQGFIKASNTDAGDLFGRSVAVSGGTVFAGANGEDSGAAGVGGDQASNSASSAGAAYALTLPSPGPSDGAGFARFLQSTDTIRVLGNTVFPGVDSTYEMSIRINPASPFGPIVSEQRDGQEAKIISVSPTSFESYMTRGVGCGNVNTAPLTSPPSSTWMHLAWVRSGSISRLFVNGQLIQSWNSQNMCTGNAPDSWMAIGMMRHGAGCCLGPVFPSFIGDLDWIRISSVARYLGPFVPPCEVDVFSDASTNLLLRFNEGPRATVLVDESPNAFVCELGVAVAPSTAATSPLLVIGGPNAPIVCYCVGDITRDGIVNGFDLGTLLSQWGPATGSASADLDGDGVIGGADLGLMLASWGVCVN